MTKHEALLGDLKEILETVNSLSKVAFGKHVPLPQESTFAAAYLIPGADTFQTKKSGKGIAAYDNAFFVRVIVNEDCSDRPLQWCDTRDEIIQAVLKDNELWSVAVDRDISSVVYDDMNSFPKMSMEIIFEFTMREDCV